MKFLKRAFVASFAALALVVAPAISAEAATPKFDVTKLSAKSMVVSSSGCRNVEIGMAHKKSGVDRWSVSTDITRSGVLRGSVDFSSSGNKSRERALMCPSSEGLGKYIIGPSEVYASSTSSLSSVSRTDYTKGSFYIRGKSYASLSSKRSGSTVTLTSSTKVYHPEHYGKIKYSPKVKFQVKSGSKWKTLKTVSSKKGKAVYRVKSKSKRYYRVTFSQVSWATSATSKSVKR